jgi:hypothetical protein
VKLEVKRDVDLTETSPEGLHLPYGIDVVEVWIRGRLFKARHLIDDGSRVGLPTTAPDETAVEVNEAG